MEEDRASTNLGPDITLALEEENKTEVKQPKRRFIGKRAAAEKAVTNGNQNGNIEDTEAIQGVDEFDEPIKGNDLLTVG